MSGSTLDWNDVDISEGRNGDPRTYFCRTCSVTLHDDHSMEKHLIGKPHLKTKQRLREDRFRSHKETDADSTGRRYHELPSQYQERIDNERYRQTGRGNDGPSAGYVPRDRSPISRDRSDPDRYHRRNSHTGRSEWYCDDCDSTCNSRDIMIAHLSGLKHQKKTKNIRRYYCDLCMVEVSSQETLDTHLQGMIHMKRQKQREFDARGSSRGNSAGSSNDLEELYDLRKRVVEKDRQIENLRMEVQKLMRFKQHCIAHHGDLGDGVKREPKREFHDDIVHLD